MYYELPKLSKVIMIPYIFSDCGVPLSDPAVRAGWDRMHMVSLLYNYTMDDSRVKQSLHLC